MEVVMALVDDPIQDMATNHISLNVVQVLN